MAYLNGTSKEKFIIPELEGDILLGNGVDAGYIYLDYSVRVDTSRENVGKKFENSVVSTSSVISCTVVRIRVKKFSIAINTRKTIPKS